MKEEPFDTSLEAHEVSLFEEDAPANERNWQFQVFNGQLRVSVWNDSFTGASRMLVERVGSRVVAIQLDGVEVYRESPA